MTPKTKQSFYALVDGCWEATQGERGRFTAFVFLFIIGYSLDLLVPWAIGYTLGIFVQLGTTQEAFYKGMIGIGIYTALRLAYTVCHHLGRWIQNGVAYSARMHITSKVFDTLMRFPLPWHVSHHSGVNLSRLHRSAGAVNQMIGTFVWQIIEGAVKIVFAGVALLALDFWVATNVLVMASLTIFTMIFFNKALTTRIRKNNTFNDKLNRICVDYLSNIVTVKTLSLEESAKRHLRVQKGEGYQIAKSIAGFMELKWGATGVGYALVISSSLFIYFYRHGTSAEAMDIAQVYVLLNYLDRIFQAIGSFTGYYSGIIEASTAYEDAVDIFDQAKRLPNRSSRVEVENRWSSLSIRNLNFTYVQGEKVGLNNVTIECKRGEKIALVGHSGSGKSTLLKVLGGLIIPDSYQLSTDVQEDLVFDDFIPHCLLLPQEPEVFSETMEYNLTMGEEFDSKEISFFMSLCKLDVLVQKMPNGLKSSLAEKGLNLSVGERQRLSLARGLIRAGKKDVILLDEPTSSLDPKTEKEIFLGLMYHFADRTMLSSCHRLNLIPLFDKIVLMSNSSVLEVGTFAELIDRRKHFYKMWEDYERNIKETSGSPQDATVPVTPSVSS